MLSSVWTSGLYTAKSHSLDHLVEDVWMSGHISFLDASVQEQFNFNINMAYRGSSRTRAIRMQQTGMFKNRQRAHEQYTMFTGVRNSCQSVVHRRSSKCMRKGG